MRKQLVSTVGDLLKSDKKVVLLLGDIGVYGFTPALQEFPDRAYNIGILEQATISMAAGLSMQGFIPIFHTIAPFIVERGLEQLKDDFGYQRLGGNFISVGGSYDYVTLGCTHHCPGDVGILKNVPEMEVVVPGTAAEFDSLLRQSYDNGRATYFKLSERPNPLSSEVVFGKANVIKQGSKATVIAVGPMLGKVLEACEGLDVTILYYTTLAPFDTETLRRHLSGGKLIVCEPHYSGSCATDIAAALAGESVETTYIGVAREFPHFYGTIDDVDAFFGLTTKDIKTKITKALL